MKKLLSMLAIAAVMASCNDSKTDETPAVMTDSVTMDANSTSVMADTSRPAMMDTSNKMMNNMSDTANKMMNNMSDTANSKMGTMKNKVGDKMDKAGDKMDKAGDKMDKAADNMKEKHP